MIKNLIPLFLFLMVFDGCNSVGIETVRANSVQNESFKVASQFDKAPTLAPSNYKTFQVGALIYDDVASAYGDAEAIAGILDEHGVTYRKVGSEELNSMSVENVAQYGMIIWPGGYASQMSDSLTANTRERIRQAVNERGVSYVGIGAGAFLAISPAGTNGHGPEWGFSLIADQTPSYYRFQNARAENGIVKIKLADRSIRSMLWWAGPSLPELSNGVLARYTDTGQPAMIQAWAGKGLVLLSGIHPEAPQSWRDRLGLIDSDGLDQDIAWKLIKAALKRRPLGSKKLPRK